MKAKVYFRVNPNHARTIIDGERADKVIKSLDSDLLKELSVSNHLVFQAKKNLPFDKGKAIPKGSFVDIYCSDVNGIQLLIASAEEVEIKGKEASKSDKPVKK